jgi:cell division topological specificity factor
MLIDLLERIFPGINDRNSRSEVKNRLKLVLAHDRAAIAPETLEAMRQEILAVVSKYVELDSDAMEISLDSSDRMTVLMANLPIRRINPEFFTVKESEPGEDENLPEIELDEALIGEPDLGAVKAEEAVVSADEVSADEVSADKVSPESAEETPVAATETEPGKSEEA